MFERYSDRARKVIVMALWSARNRGGSFIELEDLLHGLIREDRGEFTALAGEMLPGFPVVSGHNPFFTVEAATVLLRELGEDPEPRSAGAQARNLEPAPAVDMPASHSLQHVLELAAKARQNNAKTIEPLNLLAAIAEDRKTRPAQLLRDRGITRQKIAQAIASASGGSIKP